MPCDSMQGVDWGFSASQDVDRLRKTVEAMKFELDGITALLCDNCRKMETAGVPILSPLKEWWDGHKAHDAQQGR